MLLGFRRCAPLISMLLLGCPGDDGGVGGGGGSSSTGSMTTSTSSTSTPGSSGAVDTTAGEGSGGQSTSCCERHPTPACDEQEVAECVCNSEAECCAFEWSQRCVDLATSECNATCMPDGATTGPFDPTFGGGSEDSGGSEGSGGSGGPVSACCMPSMMPGCAEDPALEECVCGQDPFCCNQQWDGKCVGSAIGNCGAMCDGGGGGGDGSCCMEHFSPGCEDPQVEECVCDLDPFCCNQQWDQKCVQTASQACMGCN